MRRFRIPGMDFDSRALTLEPIPEHWEEQVKILHRQNQERTIGRLKAQYGEAGFDQKLANFRELGSMPFSVVAFHNRFQRQARQAFVHGQYYPALTATCALSERVLNHLVIGLRDDYKSSA